VNEKKELNVVESEISESTTKPEVTKLTTKPEISKSDTKPEVSKSNLEIPKSATKPEVSKSNPEISTSTTKPEIETPTSKEVQPIICKETISVPVFQEKIKKEEDDINHTLNGTAIKTEFNDNKISPNKLPTYTTMIKSALEEMNVTGGEGCSKLEILLYILRKFRPKGNVNTITTKLIKILENGTKKGDFLSSVSCPRVLKKAPEGKKETKDGEKKKEKVKEKVKKIKTKDGKIIKIKAGKLAKKDKQDKDKKEKKKRVVVQSPRKLREPLATICKAKKLTRHEVLKKIWAYIHSKKLQDPADKKIIICDENFKKLTKAKQINQSTLMSYIKPYMEPIK